MLILVGAFVVLGAVVGGFLTAGGALSALIQPSEFVVIGGAALGSLLISTPVPVIQALEEHGLDPVQVDGVRGFADRKPHFPDDPLDPRNRRVSIVVQNTV